MRDIDQDQKKIKWIFAWYDMWLGAFYDRKKKFLYLMIPFVGIRIRIGSK